MRHHEMEKVEGEYRCTVCLWTWKQSPSSICPGVPRRSADYLLTYTQLHTKHLKPVDRAKPDACYYQSKTREFIWLYDERVALPRRQETEKHKAAREKAWATTQQKYICIQCGKMPAYLAQIQEYQAGGLCTRCEEWAREEAEYEDREAMIKEDQRAACEWAAALLQRNDWCILDTETMDLHGYLVEIAVIAPDGKVLFQSVVNPQWRIGETARSIHHIGDEEVLLAPTLPELWPDLLVALQGRSTIVAYNTEFDEGTLDRDAARYGVSMPKVKWDDLMHYYSEYFGEYSEYFGDYKWQRLPGGSHRALGDCLASLDLIKSLAACLETLDKEAGAESVKRANA